MHPTTSEPNARRHEQDMNRPIEVATTSLLLAATYWYMGFRPSRIQKFVRSDVATMSFRMNRTERDQANAMIASPESVLYLKNFAEGCASLSALITKASDSGVWNEERENL